MDVELFKAVTKYPFIHNDQFFNSSELPQNKSCIEKCDKKDCLLMFTSLSKEINYTCSKGYDNVAISSGDLKVVINGLIFSDNNKVPFGRKEVRKNWICQKKDVELFVSKIHEIEKFLSQQVNDTTVKNFSMFHDFKTSINIFFSCTHEIIRGLPGDSFEAKLGGGKKEFQDLYRALNLVASQLRMIDIVVNPSSIVFGNKRVINIYRLFDKMKMLFEHLAIQKRDIAIEFMPGPWIPDSLCYESIEFIPLILLDNALKYAVPDSVIEVKMERAFDNIKIIVKNIGPLVKDGNKDKIFDKFYRDESARNFCKEGIGVGLWIAQNILEAHGSKLYYYQNPNEVGKTIGLNIFTFDLSVYQQPVG